MPPWQPIQQTPAYLELFQVVAIIVERPSTNREAFSPSWILFVVLHVSVDPPVKQTVIRRFFHWLRRFCSVQAHFACARTFSTEVSARRYCAEEVTAAIIALLAGWTDSTVGLRGASESNREHFTLRQGHCSDR